jgi:polyhydroxyalkanoate synthesis regulator phasin
LTEPQSADATETTEQTGGEQQATEQQATEQAEAPKKKTRAKSTAKKTRSVELTLTVTGTAEGEWQADLVHQGKRVVQGLSIPAAAVTKAASELHPDISEAIDEVVTAAREQHQAKLAELEAEVERVRKTLAELEG